MGSIYTKNVDAANSADLSYSGLVEHVKRADYWDGHIWGKTLHFSVHASASVRENVPNDFKISHLIIN